MDIPHMISILQVYIHIRKDKQVKINQPKNHRDLILLVKMYDYAISWMEQNNTKITLIN